LQLPLKLILVSTADLPGNHFRVHIQPRDEVESFSNFPRFIHFRGSNIKDSRRVHIRFTTSISLRRPEN
jgi:hypothetical protein